MKCEKCGNEYPGAGYFAVPGICNDCFDKLSDEEKKRIIKEANSQPEIDEQEEKMLAQRVGFGKRFLALLIDGFILYMLQYLITMFGGLQTAQVRLAEHISEAASHGGGDINKVLAATQSLTAQMQVDFYWTFVSIQLVILLYLSLEMMVGATLGKLILGIQIGTKDGHHAPTKILVKRFLIKESYTVFALLSAVTLWKPMYYLGIAAGIVIVFGCFLVFTSRKIAFHDLIAGTAVYSRRYLDGESDESNNETEN